MNHKVLLADDSLTIQKVIRITLANQPYDITDCSSEEELFKKLAEVQPKIVFLDFNLSDKYTGYELTTKIKSMSPSTKVLLLLGTFDNVDEAMMEKSGASDKIVKPFDSNKFIAICKQLMDTFAEDDLPYPEPQEKPEAIQEDSDSQWTMNHSTERKLPEFPEEKDSDSSKQGLNPLMSEVHDWGMSVPEIIGTPLHEKMADLPPVIGEVTSPLPSQSAFSEKNEDQKFPETEDLDYPAVEEIKTIISEEESKPKAKSKLISIEDFKDVEELEIEPNYVADEADVSSIEAQIRDEVEEDLWVADEYETLKKEVFEKLEEAKNFQPTKADFDESLFQPLDESESIDWVEPENAFKAQEDTSKESNPAEIEKLVKKYVKEYMDEMFKNNVEKVAWEVIPDLAENLIRQELSKISHKVLED